MVIAPYYREFDLPWDGDPEQSERFRTILRVLLIALLVLGILFPLLPSPKRAQTPEVPQVLARVMLENKPKPPPPPPPAPTEQANAQGQHMAASPAGERTRAHQ